MALAFAISKSSTMPKDKKSRRGSTGGKGRVANCIQSHSLEILSAGVRSADKQNNDKSAATNAGRTSSEGTTVTSGSLQHGSAESPQELPSNLTLTHDISSMVEMNAANHDGDASTHNQDSNVLINGNENISPPAFRTRSRMTLHTVKGVDSRDEMKVFQTKVVTTIQKTFASASRKFFKIVSPRLATPTQYSPVPLSTPPRGEGLRSSNKVGDHVELNQAVDHIAGDTMMNDHAKCSPQDESVLMNGSTTLIVSSDVTTQDNTKLSEVSPLQAEEVPGTNRASEQPEILPPEDAQNGIVSSQESSSSHEVATNHGIHDRIEVKTVTTNLSHNLSAGEVSHRKSLLNATACANSHVSHIVGDTNQSQTSKRASVAVAESDSTSITTSVHVPKRLNLETSSLHLPSSESLDEPLQANHDKETNHDDDSKQSKSPTSDGSNQTSISSLRQALDVSKDAARKWIQQAARERGHDISPSQIEEIQEQLEMEFASGAISNSPFTMDTITKAILDTIETPNEAQDEEREKIGKTTSTVITQEPSNLQGIAHPHHVDHVISGNDAITKTMSNNSSRQPRGTNKGKEKHAADSHRLRSLLPTSSEELSDLTGSVTSPTSQRSNKNDPKISTAIANPTSSLQSNAHGVSEPTVTTGPLAKWLEGNKLDLKPQGKSVPDARQLARDDAVEISPVLSPPSNAITMTVTQTQTQTQTHTQQQSQAEKPAASFPGHGQSLKKSTQGGGGDDGDDPDDNNDDDDDDHGKGDDQPPSKPHNEKHVDYTLVWIIHSYLTEILTYAHPNSPKSAILDKLHDMTDEEKMDQYRWFIGQDMDWEYLPLCNSK